MSWFNEMSAIDLVWTGVGFGGQLLFSARFIYQWIVSERARRSIVPEAFWYFSFAGGLTLLAYAVYKHDPVFVVGQGSGLFIYGRNIWLIWAEKRRSEEPAGGVTA
jgi:lipid-A-disaccharide synthase-like uncharacterized protein